MSPKTVLCAELCASGVGHPEEWHRLSGAAPQVGRSISGAHQCLGGHLGGLCWPQGMVEHSSTAREQISFFTTEKD